MKFDKTCDIVVALAVGYFSGHLLNIVTPLVLAIIGGALIAAIVYSIVKERTIY